MKSALMSATMLSLLIGSATLNAQTNESPSDSFPPAAELLPDDSELLSGLPPASRQLSFADGLVLLNDNSRQLDIARQNLEDAEILQQQIRALYFPRVNLSAQYTLNDEEVEFSTGNPYAGLTRYLDSVYDTDPTLQAEYPYAATPQNCAGEGTAGDARCLAIAPVESGVIRYRHNYTFSGQVTQPLFNGQIFSGRRLAENAELRAINSVEQAAFALQEAYIQLYFGAVAQQRQISAAINNVNNAKISYEQARILFEEEAGSRFDVSRAAVSFSSARRALRNAYTAYSIQIRSLAALMNTPADFNITPPTELTAPDNIEQLKADAWNNRPDIEAAALTVEQAELQIARANSGWMPTVDAIGSANLTRASALSGDAFTWSLAVVASWDLYDGGVRTRERRTAEADQVRAELELDQLRDDIETDLDSRWLDLENQQIQIESAQEEAALARENLALTREARTLGAASAIDVELAQNQVFAAELAAINAETALQQVIYDLYRLGASNAMFPAPTASAAE